MDNKQHTIALNTLRKMVEEPQSLFDPEIAQYLMSKIDLSLLKNTLFYPNRMGLKTNLFGYILNKHLKGFLPDNEEKNTDLKEIQEHKNFIEQWTNILKSKDASLVEHPVYNSQFNEQTKLSVNGLLLVVYPTEFPIEKIDLLTDKESLFFSNSLINGNTNFYHSTKKMPPDFLVELFVKHIDEVKKSYTEEDWIKRILGSCAKNLLKIATQNQLEKIFPHESLKVLISQFLLVKNSHTGAEVFNDILGLASPEQWMKAFSGKEFKIDSFFNSIFNKAFGYTMVGNLKRGHENEYYKECFFTRLNYFKQAFKTTKFNEKSLENFWEAVIEVNDKNLFLQAVKSLPMPQKNINEKSYQKIIETSRFDDGTAYNDMYILGLKEKLEEALLPLSVTSERPKLKL